MAQVATLSDTLRTKDAVNFEALKRFFPIRAVKKTLEKTGKSSQRERELPADVMVFYVIAMTIYMGSPYREVLRKLLEGSRSSRKRKGRVKPPVKSSIYKGRMRLGVEPLQELHDEFVKPIATKKTVGAWYRDWLTVAVDASTIDIADTPENVKEFGKSKSGRGKSAFPKLRFVSLIETGTRVPFATKFGGIKYASENKLAHEVLPFLRKGMLCLADRLYLGYDLLKIALDTKADVLWRVSNTFKLPPEMFLPDGSYESTLYKSDADRKHKRNGIKVRLIEYKLKGVPDSEKYRLVTSILDYQVAPADELAALYHERWEIEKAYDELKTHLRGAGVVLRSRKPALVKQEFYGFLLGYFAVRGLMHEAALKENEDPDRLSFSHAVHVIRRKLPQFAAFPPTASA